MCGDQFFDTTTTSTYYYDKFFVSKDTVDYIYTRDSINLIGFLSLYPNPTEGIINVELSKKYTAKELEICIYNEAGELCHYEAPQVIYSNKMEIDISHLPNGFYMIQLSRSDGKIDREKFVKQ